MNNTIEVIKGIYLGKRDLSFKSFITMLLKKTNMNQDYIDFLTNQDNMDIYSAVFTSELVDEIDNYQFYEQLGDLTGNKFIVWYIYERFPQLKCTEGVKIAARLRINYGAKNSFFGIAEKLGFWDFISAPIDLRQRKKKSLLEDVFEAFIGATEYILDAYISTGSGYKYVYQFLKNVFDDINISLKYEDLYDGKTRLKELFDMYKDKIGTLYYEEKKEDLITFSYCYRIEGYKGNIDENTILDINKIHNCRKILIGKGSAALKADAQQSAANDALKNLEKQGFSKKSPDIYLKLSDDNYIENKTSKNEILQNCKNIENINSQYMSRGKNNYQNKYTSTVLGMYCRKRDYDGIKECLKLGAKSNVLDSEEMYCLDLLLMGPYHPKFIYKIMSKFLEKENKLYLHKNVFEIYYNLYLVRENKYKNKFDVLKDNLIIV